MKNILRHKFVMYFVAGIYLFITMSTPTYAAEELSSSDTQKVIEAFHNASTYGFVDYEQYKKFNGVFNKYNERDFDSKPLSDSERQELEKLVNELRNTIPNWIKKLIQDAKLLESDGIVKFNNPNWKALENECINVGSPLSSKVPLDDFVEILEKMNSGQDFDWEEFESSLERDYNDCARHIEGFVRQVSKAKENLEKELAILDKKIIEKEEECRTATGQDQVKCNEELDELYQEFEEKEEQVSRLEEFEDEGMKLKAILGLAAIIAGVVIGVYCCPELGATIAAWGGQTLEDSQHYKKERVVHESKVTGRKRVLNQSGDVTEEETQSLIDDLKEKGFEQVPVDDRTPGKIAYEVFQSEEELRVYLVKDKKLIARVESINVDIKENSRNVVRLGSVQVSRINGDIFIEDNRIKLNVIGDGPDGQSINVSIVETSVGSNRFTLIVE